MSHFSLRMVQRQDPRPQPDPIPKVGDGVTHGAGSDSYPGTVIEVNKTGKTIVFQDDNHRVVKGSFQTGDAEIEYSPNPNGAKHTARWTVSHGVGAYRYDRRAIGVGHRRYYQDPHF